MTEGNGKILSLGDKRHFGRDNDYITRKQAAELVAAEATKVHEYYLNQIPPFVARMIQDALISYGLVQVAPGTTDIAPTHTGEATSGAPAGDGATLPTAAPQAGGDPAPPPGELKPLDAEVIAAPVPPVPQSDR